MSKKKQNAVVYIRRYKWDKDDDIYRPHHLIVNYLNENKNVTVQEIYRDSGRGMSGYRRLITDIFEERVDKVLVVDGIKRLEVIPAILDKIKQNVELVELK